MGWCRKDPQGAFTVTDGGYLKYNGADIVKSFTHPTPLERRRVKHARRLLEGGTIIENLEDRPIQPGEAWTPAIQTSAEGVVVRIEDRRDRSKFLPIGEVRVQVPDGDEKANAAYKEAKERVEIAQKANADTKSAWEAEQKDQAARDYPELKSWDLYKKMRPCPSHKLQKVPEIPERPLVSNPDFADQLADLRAKAEDRASDMNIMQEVCK